MNDKTDIEAWEEAYKTYGISKKCQGCTKDCKQLGFATVQYCPKYEKLEIKDVA